jgi:hypothetical protein
MDILEINKTKKGGVRAKGSRVLSHGVKRILWPPIGTVLKENFPSMNPLLSQSSKGICVRPKVSTPHCEGHWRTIQNLDTL